MSGRGGQPSNIIGFPGTDGRGGSSFPPGGGGPYDPSMEARVAALEASLGRIELGINTSAQLLAGVQKDLGDVKKDVSDVRKELTEQGKAFSRLDGRVGALPTTLQMFGFVLAVLALAGLGRYLAP
jgi:hypothetical protein